MIRTYYLTPGTNSKLVVDVTKKSDKTSINSPCNENYAEINVQPYDFHDYMVDVSQQIENRYGSYELSQNIEKYGENLSGSYYSGI